MQGRVANDPVTRKLARADHHREDVRRMSGGTGYGGSLHVPWCKSAVELEVVSISSYQRCRESSVHGILRSVGGRELASLKHRDAT